MTPLDPDPLTVQPDDDLPARTGITIPLVLAVVIVVAAVLLVSRLAG